MEFTDTKMQVKKLGSLVQAALATAGLLVATSVSAHAQSPEQTQDIDTEASIAVVQNFIDSMDYQFLSAADKEVWDEAQWNEIQQHAAGANQVRLQEGHEFHQLEALVREQVKVEAVAAEPAQDGSIKVTTEMHYPQVLMLIDDFIDTRNSYTYELLLDYQRALDRGELDASELASYTSEMPWRVIDGGVHVDAKQMQENRDALQAQGW